METPFDSLISGLWQLTINDRDWNSSQSEVIKSVFAFSKITRVLYINMVQASETPICDMEEYCKTLAGWLEALPLQ